MKFRGEYAFLSNMYPCKEGEIVEENSWRDTYWGVCKGVGENHLGKILMKIRDELIAGSLDSTSNVCED